MKEVRISLNQLADFSKASEAKKRSIIKQQKTPNPFKIPWYQLTRSRIRQAIKRNGDLAPVIEGIKELLERKPEKPRQVNDRIVSIEALRRFVNIKLPSLLRDVPHEVVKRVDSKSIFVQGVEVIVSPDVIFRMKIDNQIYLGAVKVHISKGNVFDNKQSRYVSSTIYKYLKEVVAKKGEIVHKELCLSIDVFGERVIHAPRNLSKAINEIEVICEEVKSLWSAA